jgi:hypothetical protein
VIASSSSAKALQVLSDCLPSAGLHLWTGDRLSDTAINAGLFDWLIDRTR